jgi:crotonobetainyl-CoA:carnitine CoA-transferase CaiB-like acyl-CoA transferase
VEVGMFETMASFMLVEHANGAMFDPPLSPAFYPRAVAPNRKPYRTRDGYISALIYNDKQWSTFVEAVRPPWASDPSYATLELRARKIDSVYRLLADTFKERTTEEWLKLFRSLDIPAAPLRTPDDLMNNAHLNAVGFFETVDSPHGPVRFPGVPTWFSRTPGRVAGAAPLLGADTQAVLEEFGLPAAQATPAQSAKKDVL